jgi:hypothetical protein
MFLKVQDDSGFGIIEVLDLKGLFDPFALKVNAKGFTVARNCKMLRITQRLIFAFPLESRFLDAGVILTTRYTDK